MAVLLQSDSISTMALDFMDREHLDEIHLINRLYEILNHDLLISIVYPEAVQCLKQLITGTTAHFDNEENLMRKRKYPGIEKHIGKHTAFMTILQEANDNFVATRDKLKLLDFMENVLKDWFIDHLQTEDFRLAEFSRKRRT